MSSQIHSGCKFGSTHITVWVWRSIMSSQINSGCKFKSTHIAIRVLQPYIILEQNQKKCNTAKENIQRTENRQTEKAITEATLIPWIAGLSGPIKKQSQSETLQSPVTSRSLKFEYSYFHISTAHKSQTYCAVSVRVLHGDQTFYPFKTCSLSEKICSAILMSKVSILGLKSPFFNLKDPLCALSLLESVLI